MYNFCMIDQKGMTFDHDFGCFFPLFSSLLKKEGRRKGEWIAKIVIESHAFLFDPFVFVKEPFNTLAFKYLVWLLLAEFLMWWFQIHWKLQNFDKILTQIRYSPKSCLFFSNIDLKIIIYCVWTKIILFCRFQDLVFTEYFFKTS